MVLKLQNASNRIDMMSSLVLGFWSIMSIFFFCELGEQMTNQFDAFYDELNQCQWYSFPIELQRMMTTVILNAQQSAIIGGFGNTLCTRFSFNKVNIFLDDH